MNGLAPGQHLLRGPGHSCLLQEEVIFLGFLPNDLLIELSPDWLRLVTGARGDVFNYDVTSKINTAGGDLNGNVTRARPNVKANLILGPWYQTELFANFGTGFHSNDAGGVILDPRTPALPTARGYEFGAKTKILPRVEFSVTYWVLDLASELVFNGDDGTTEARGPSHREGWEFATRVKLLDWLTFSGDVTTTQAAFETGKAVRAPLAPRVTARADLTARLPGDSPRVSPCVMSVTGSATRIASKPPAATRSSILRRATVTGCSRRS